ncbi:sulfatase-like hydrolase/transferase [Paenibacillus cisolokensis]|uniref:sulfatase-like hydrolase/transferase n=1 Tax=Paenibacillus cisolokensis TaxID=1658519 RepID=UPI001FD43B9B|nr:sulfatase-like hydrolase/transferase [Paenibacillus cisolokensis]
MKIVFVSLDTLRASRLGAYGYGKPTSPYLDRIASQGVLFERAYAADIPTEVAHTGIFTGKAGLTTGVVAHGSELTSLPRSVGWLPAMLFGAGLTTAAIDNLYQLKEWFARGYRYYINSSGRQRWIDGRTVNDLAKAWLNEHADEDFFSSCIIGIRIRLTCLRRSMCPVSTTRVATARSGQPEYGAGVQQRRLSVFQIPSLRPTGSRHRRRIYQRAVRRGNPLSRRFAAGAGRDAGAARHPG